MVRERQILAGSGVIYPPDDFPPDRVGVQLWQAMQLPGVRRPRMCLIATATGDSREYIDRWYERVRFFGDAELSHLELFVQPNGVALHYVGTRLHEALSVLPDRNAWFVEANGPGRYREEAVPARCWVPGTHE
jgi:hypothetical protein